MERLPEPELMNDAAQVQAYADADFSAGDQDLIRNLEQLLSKEQRSSNPPCLFLDLGCGPGNISERLARRWPRARVIGIDAAENMLSVARRRQQQAADLCALEYQCIALMNLGQDQASLPCLADVVVSNSLLHHLHDPQVLWRGLAQITAPGAVILHRDLRRPETNDQAEALQRKHLKGAPAILIRDFLASLQAAFTVAEVNAQLKEAGLEKLKVCEIGDRHLEVSGTI